MKQKIKVGMPHLNYNGLDLVWLLKTSGDAHWSMLKDVKSFNENNQRLYASFFACEIDYNKGQDYFVENEEINLDSKIFKFNNQIYRSMHSVTGNQNVATLTMDSIFVKKDIASGSLIKDDPVASGKNIQTVSAVFLEEHKKMKKELTTLEIEKFNKLVFSPEMYFNGVKILYFANYINLSLLNEYITFDKILSPIKKVKIFFFKNISEHDVVYGYTKNINNEYHTILMSNNKPISLCINVRD
jgi:probable biosynthetic protein (TIGR04098 family)